MQDSSQFFYNYCDKLLELSVLLFMLSLILTQKLIFLPNTLLKFLIKKYLFKI